jgi:sulfur carrier protein ThiS
MKGVPALLRGGPDMNSLVAIGTGAAYLYSLVTTFAPAVLPAEARYDNRVPLELPEGSTVAQVIEPFGLPPKLVHLVLVNGRYIAPEQRLSATLNEGDVLAIWPPIAGG